MSIHVLDSSAIIAYLRGETGDLIVDRLLNNRSTVCYVHAINLCEVFYDAIRRTNILRARRIIRDLRNVGIIERKDMSCRFWERVGQHKARGGISLPDCFCITLAQELGGEVVTADHAEFDPLVPLGIVPIHFIR